MNSYAGGIFKKEMAKPMSLTTLLLSYIHGTESRDAGLEITARSQGCSLDLVTLNPLHQLSTPGKSPFLRV